jgi:hypothetical protein
LINELNLPDIVSGGRICAPPTQICRTQVSLHYLRGSLHADCRTGSAPAAIGRSMICVVLHFQNRGRSGARQMKGWL